MADDLKERISPDDTLFIFAKAAQGPAVPLAVHRTTAGALPLTVVLNDDMAMTPNLKLSAFDAYSIIARISKKGDAKAQKGDLFGQQTGQSRRSNCFIHQPNTTLIAAKNLPSRRCKLLVCHAICVLFRKVWAHNLKANNTCQIPPDAVSGGNC